MSPAGRRAASAAALVAALVTGCGAATGGTPAASPGAAGGSAVCATDPSCSVTDVVPPASSPPRCTSAGSGRTDRFDQQVALQQQPDGLRTGDITAGAGPPLRAGQLVTVAYSGWLQDGTLFDSSRRPGASPLATVLGSHQLIPGFEEALGTMRVGGVRRAVIPPQLGYGASGGGPIPPNATLTFDIEVLCAA